MALEDATVPDYLDLPLERFLEQVAAPKPAPGGDASAAVTVALAAALSSMSARLSADHLGEATALAKRAERLRGEVLSLARRRGGLRARARGQPDPARR